MTAGEAAKAPRRVEARVRGLVRSVAHGAGKREPSTAPRECRCRQAQANSTIHIEASRRMEQKMLRLFEAC